MTFESYAWRRDIFNFSMFRNRNFDGFMVSGFQSGTQWIKWMLSQTIAAQWGVAPPQYYDNESSNDIIGHPKHKKIYPELPRIASSHNVPSAIMDWPISRALFRFPPYIVVVRDLRQVMLSHYAKHGPKYRENYGTSFTEYLHSDITNSAPYLYNIGNYIRFLNRWGDAIERYPNETIAIHYEDTRKDPAATLRRIGQHFGLSFTDAAIDTAVKMGTKEEMAKYSDPAIPYKIVRPDDDTSAPVYTDADKAYFGRIVQNHLRHNFGYDYPTWHPTT